MSDIKKRRPKKETFKFAGVSLGGGKTDRTSVCVLEFFAEHEKLFLTHLHAEIKPKVDRSADWELIELLNSEENDFEFIGFDVPLMLPKCMRCTLKCPGYEKCKLPEIKWMWKLHRSKAKEKRPNKIFTPYTERCVDMWINNSLEESFNVSHALGSNAAPLTARAHFIKRRLKPSQKIIEAVPKISLYRIGTALKVQKSYLRFHKHSIDSHAVRESILHSFIDSDLIFIYEQDLKTMVENTTAFDSLLVALTGYLKFKNLTEKPPRDFPKFEPWVEMPSTDLEIGEE